eukprot:c25055_g1_i2 orf=720-1535(+)
MTKNQQQKQKGKGKEKKTGNGAKSETSKKKDKTCYNCGETGHYRDDCPNPKKEKEKESTTATVARPRAFVHLELIDGGEPSSDEVALASSSPTRVWVVDSGATRHMTPTLDGFRNLREMQGDICIGDSSHVPIEGIGDLTLIPDGKGGSLSGEVLYVPGLGFHLLSMKELCRIGLQVEFLEDRFCVRDLKTKSLLCSGKFEHGLYRLRIPKSSMHILVTSLGDLWHARFGHLNHDYLRQAFREKMVVGLPDIGTRKSSCSSCMKGKQHREP